MSTPRVTGSLLMPIIAVLIFALPLSPWMVENFYSNNMYHWWQSWLTALSNLVPFALLDLFILGLIVLVVWRSTRLVALARSQGVRLRDVRRLRDAGFSGSAVSCAPA